MLLLTLPQKSFHSIVGIIFHAWILLPLCCCSFAKLCPTLCNPTDCSIPGFPVLHHLPEFAQIPVHHICDAIQPSHSLLLPSIIPSIRVFSNESNPQILQIEVQFIYRPNIITYTENLRAGSFSEPNHLEVHNTRTDLPQTTDPGSGRPHAGSQCPAALCDLSP